MEIGFCCGDVLLVSFNKASRKEDNILDQIYKKKANMYSMMILILYNIIRKCILTKQ